MRKTSFKTGVNALPGVTAATSVPSGETATSTGRTPSIARFTRTVPSGASSVITLITALDASNGGGSMGNVGPASPTKRKPESSASASPPSPSSRGPTKPLPANPPPPPYPPCTVVETDAVDSAWCTAITDPDGAWTVRHATCGMNPEFGRHERVAAGDGDGTGGVQAEHFGRAERAHRDGPVVDDHVAQVAAPQPGAAAVFTSAGLAPDSQTHRVESWSPRFLDCILAATSI